MKKYLLTLFLSCAVTPAWATDLMDIYQQAAQSDPTYQAAASQRLSDREALPQNVANLLPTIKGIANTIGNRSASSNVPSSAAGNPVGTYRYNTKSYNLSLDEPVLNFSNWLGISQAHYTAKEADATLASAAQDLIVRVAKAYFAVLQAQDNLRFVQAKKAAFARQLDQAKARYSVGLDAITTVYNAQASYDGSIADEITAQNILHDNQEALRQLTGQTYPAVEGFKIELPLLTPQPNDVEQWVNTATQHNADLLSKTYAMEAARQKIKVKFGGHLPTVDVVGNYGRNSQNGPGSVGSGNGDTRNIGLQLSVPIFSGGATASQVREAKYDYQTASANREKQYRQTIVDSRQKFNDVLAGISKVEADKQAILSAQASLDSTEESYKVGTRTIVDVLQAEQALYEAKNNYSKDGYQYLSDTLALKAAAGTLAPSDLQAINNWLHGSDKRDQKIVGIEIPLPSIADKTTHKKLATHKHKVQKNHKTRNQVKKNSTTDVA